MIGKSSGGGQEEVTSLDGWMDGWTDELMRGRTQRKEKEQLCNCDQRCRRGGERSPPCSHSTEQVTYFQACHLVAKERSVRSDDLHFASGLESQLAVSSHGAGHGRSGNGSVSFPTLRPRALCPHLCLSMLCPCSDLFSALSFPSRPLIASVSCFYDVHAVWDLTTSFLPTESCFSLPINKKTGSNTSDVYTLEQALF